MKRFWILDERHVWWEAALEAAKRHGYRGERILRGEQVTDGVGFIRPHANPEILKRNQTDDAVMRERLLMIQDRTQVELYEDKSGQFARWGKWMPPTWRFTSMPQAVAFLARAEYPLVSKADVGASSRNVRILANRSQAERHVRELFGPGVIVDHCSGGRASGAYKSRQRGYVLLQQFIPHDVTWRVNAIGDARAIFKRYCYPDRPVAQTGNVEPVMELDAETESLLEYADRFVEECGSKWLAIDVLKDGHEWKLLETSLAWPWPSPGRCNEGTIFRSGRVWIDMFDVMFEELERGAFNSSTSS